MWLGLEHTAATGEPACAAPAAVMAYDGWSGQLQPGAESHHCVMTAPSVPIQNTSRWSWLRATTARPLPVPAEPAQADRIIVPMTSEPAALAPGNAWEAGLEAEALALLATGRSDVWDVLSRRFESKLIQTALLNTRGRRIEAAQKLGIGRNTITRKIQELHLE